MKPQSDKDYKRTWEGEAGKTMLLLKPPAALTTPTPRESKETKICKHQCGCSLQPNEYLGPLKLKIHEWQIPVFLSKGNLLVVYEHLNNSTRYMILWYWSYDNILIWWSSYDDHLLVNGSALNSPGREAGKAALFTISGQGSGLGNGEEKKKKIPIQKIIQHITLQALKCTQMTFHQRWR